MEIEELRKLCDKQNEHGLDTLVLKMPAPKSWDKGGWPGERVRSPFGLCRWTGGYHDNNIVIFPTVAQVRKYIKKAENQTFYKVVINLNEGWVGIQKFTLKTENQIDPGLEVSPRRFYSKEEALRAVTWVCEQLKSGLAPSKES